MAIDSIFWDDGPGGNVEHIAEHGFTIDDFEHIMSVFDGEAISRSSGASIVFGTLEDGRRVTAVFDWIDEQTILPLTMYEVDE